MWIRKGKGFLRPALTGVLLLLAGLGAATLAGLSELGPGSLSELIAREAVPLFTDRHGLQLNRTYQTRFNTHDLAALHDMPTLLVNAFITAEDGRFHHHHGIDWPARLHALWQNLKARRAVRGASTISEQVIRIIHPRPRTCWSRWLEGWDAVLLERRCSKEDILEFYLNQVPFSASQRGVVQAARHFFARSLDTLNQQEMLALAAMVRAPSLLDPHTGRAGLEKRMAVLARRMRDLGHLPPARAGESTLGEQAPAPPQLTVQAPHFLAFVRDQHPGQTEAGLAIRTTLDGELQRKAQELLDQRLADVAEYGLHDGAILIVDHTTAEVLVWAVAGERTGKAAAHGIDPITTPRQPGSTLKPLVYALALDSGWTPATPIKDEPITEAVDHGLHVYRNFSQTYYGPLPLAEALGNSLNTPAVKTLDFVGLRRFHTALRTLGIHSLRQASTFYGNGLVLGNGEITLLELVQAYGALARQGSPMPEVRVFADDPAADTGTTQPFCTPDSARTIGTILSDSNCRQLEFGTHSILDFPVRTAVKTGTSTGGNDVWTLAYDARFVVGIWFGNLDRSAPTRMISGAGGPALLARSMWAELRKRQGYHPLPAEPLEMTSLAGHQPPSPRQIRMLVPSTDMEVLLDPRIPQGSQRIPFFIAGLADTDSVIWTVDGREEQESQQARMLWPVTQGSHEVSALIRTAAGATVTLPPRRFTVR